MNPDTQRPTTPVIPPRDAAAVVPERSTGPAEQTAAANVVRGQIDTIYDHHDPLASTSSAKTSPYHQTHSTTEHAHADQWKQYHSAWQRYYQQYYERYYIGEVYKTKADLASQPIITNTAPLQPEVEPTTNTQPAALDRTEAMHELRSQVRSQVNTTAKKVRGSRHFIPIAAAFAVMSVFLFLQYNRTLFAAVEAYTSPGNIDPANIIVDPTVGMTVGPDPLLIIPKLNIDVPVRYDASPQHDSQMAAMENGVAYFGIPGANSKPGQIGNTVIAGHSSNDVFDQGSYKFIFARLEQLKKGDSIYLNYEGKRYTYTVTGSREVQPTDVASLTTPTDKPIVTLITCTPVGTALRRLLVTAEQISPDPSTAAPAPDATGTADSTVMPGNSSTFVERIFGR